MGRWKGLPSWVSGCRLAIPVLPSTCFVCNLGEGASSPQGVPQFAHLEMGVIITPSFCNDIICVMSIAPYLAQNEYSGLVSRGEGRHTI